MNDASVKVISSINTLDCLRNKRAFHYTSKIFLTIICKRQERRKV